MGALMKRWTVMAASAASITVVLSACLSAAFAQNSPSDILRTLNYREGSIALGDQLATIRVGPNFRYLDSVDTQTFLTKVWGNPPGAGKGTLGMLVSIEAHPLSDEGYAIILSYEA